MPGWRPPKKGKKEKPESPRPRLQNAIGDDDDDLYTILLDKEKAGTDGQQQQQRDSNSPNREKGIPLKGGTAASTYCLPTISCDPIKGLENVLLSSTDDIPNQISPCSL